MLSTGVRTKFESGIIYEKTKKYKCNKWRKVIYVMALISDVSRYWEMTEEVGL